MTQGEIVTFAANCTLLNSACLFGIKEFGWYGNSHALYFKQTYFYDEKFCPFGLSNKKIHDAA